LAGSGLATTFHVQVVDSVPAGTTQIENTVELDADNVNSTTVSFDFTPITSAAVLSLSKTDGDTSVVPGSSVVYQIDYGNSGDQDAADTFIFETIPNGTSFDANLSSPNWSCSGTGAFDTCTYDVGTLSGGDNFTVDFAVNLFSPVSVIMEEIENTVRIEASNATTQFANDTTPVIADASLRIVKTDGGVTAGLDKVINYALIFFNDGNQDAEAIIITETVPDQTTFYPPASSNGWNCSPNNNAGSTCTYNSIFLGGDGGKDTVFFAVKTPSEFNPNIATITNTAAISALSTNSTDQDSVSTTIDSSPPTLNSVTVNPDFMMLPSCSQNNIDITEITAFLEDEDFFGLIGADDPSNYLLIDTGDDNDLQTTNCDIALGDDQIIVIDSFSYNAGNPISIVNLTLETALTDGQYVLTICDSITDNAGNQLDGDQDGLQGGQANHQFRVELDNLFENAYLDDCSDSPIELTPWSAIYEIGDMVDVTLLSDTDDSSLSGSVFADSLAGINAGIEQCIDFPALKSHAVSSAVLGSPTQMGDLVLQISCDFSDLASCGNVIGNHTESFTLPASATPSWTTYESIMLLPANTLSANCSVQISSPVNSPFTNYLDALKVRDSDLIFANGFENN
jgi:uncharacterized repeat protein (TIGR01451 family)